MYRTMTMTFRVGRPSELVQALQVSDMNIQSIRVICETHFWNTTDNIHNLVEELGKHTFLEELVIMGESYPDLVMVNEFLMFLDMPRCRVNTLLIPILTPFPGQYRIQDRIMITNTIVSRIHNCRSIRRVIFRSKNGEDEWVEDMNAKMRSILRNRDSTL